MKQCKIEGENGGCREWWLPRMVAVSLEEMTRESLPVHEG